MLQAAANLAPRGVYVCGNTTSTAGLTVTLAREAGSGDFALEAGALVLADQGQTTSNSEQQICLFTCLFVCCCFLLFTGLFVCVFTGCCCIDEFDKMGSQHHALLEAMVIDSSSQGCPYRGGVPLYIQEQQCVSLAKAGVVCSLPARASILAAANPTGGHYNKAKTVSENLKFVCRLFFWRQVFKFFPLCTG